MEIKNPVHQYIKKQENIPNVLAHEKEFSEPEKIITLSKGCFICKADIKGNEKSGYYCKKCNILFTQKDINSMKN